MPDTKKINNYKNQSVLYIDDDEDDLSLFKMALDALDNRIPYFAVDSAAEALNLLSEGEISPDLILLDLNMPGLTGFDFLSIIKAHSGLSYIPIIVLSTSVNEKDMLRAKELGAKAFFTKPSTFNELCNILTQVFKDEYLIAE
ncbi:response regulator [Chryseosolibacter indicus]|uniref:Response regulator n=1 Tax=Chryseosolibacter indicus TaxID=2782351 RepID=A0ABS5VLC2_9BACT|nr:response regulator [Chryseosolibacter indicus]MBT1702253.1 response regulator [Chryseosolibacter indicus]